jgi:hypothetical protein
VVARLKIGYIFLNLAMATEHLKEETTIIYDGFEPVIRLFLSTLDHTVSVTDDNKTIIRVSCVELIRVIGVHEQRMEHAWLDEALISKAGRLKS